MVTKQKWKLRTNGVFSSLYFQAHEHFRTKQNPVWCNHLLYRVSTSIVRRYNERWMLRCRGNSGFFFSIVFVTADDLQPLLLLMWRERINLLVKIHDNHSFNNEQNTLHAKDIRHIHSSECLSITWIFFIAGATVHLLAISFFSFFFFFYFFVLRFFFALSSFCIIFARTNSLILRPK